MPYSGGQDVSHVWQTKIFISRRNIYEEKNFEFVNALSPEMREELGFPKEGLSREENPAEKTAHTSLYLSKFAQASKEGNTPQPTPSKQR